MALANSASTRSIVAHELDDPRHVVPFSARLARDNLWPPGYTTRVIREYRRFLLLAATAEHRVAPSDAVDQAWQLHLLSTREYRIFCRTVLGRRLEHRPCCGGAAEQARLARDYALTLVAYWKTFGEHPPADIWPEWRVRCGDDVSFARVNVAEAWVMRKPSVWRWFSQSVAPALPPFSASFVGGVLTFATAAWGAFLGARELEEGAFLSGMLFAWGVTVVSAFLLVWRETRQAGHQLPAPRLDPYELAFLARGGSVTVDAALTVLVGSEALSFDGLHGRVRAEGAPPEGTHWLEQCLFDEVQRDSEVRLAEIRRSGEKYMDIVSMRLFDHGLLWTGSFVPAFLGLYVPAAVAGRIAGCLTCDRPFSATVLLGITGVCVAWWLWPRARLTPSGKARLKELERQLGGCHRGESCDVRETLPPLMALQGFRVLASLGLSEWSAFLQAGTNGGEGGG